MLLEKLENSKLCKRIEKFFSSDFYFLTLILCMIIPFAFKKYFVGLWIISIIGCFALVFSKNLMPFFAAFLFASMSVFEMHRASYQEIFSAIYIAIPLVISFVFHLIAYPIKKYKPSKTFFCQLAVSVAITIAGIGATNAKEYFAISTVYFTLFLGFGLLGILVLLDVYTYDTSEYDVSVYFSKTMFFIGLTIILMWLCAIFQDLPSMGNEFKFPYRQWKNNVGNFMLISIPCTLYYGTQKKRSWMYFILAAIQFLAVVMSLSRGSMIMAIALAPFEIILFFIAIKNKTQRIINLSILGVILTIAIVSLFVNDMYVLKFIEKSLHISEGEARWKLFKTGIDNFRRYPIFGIGLGYQNHDVHHLNDMSIFWYHSTPIQIVASMGIIGVICYAYQFFVRMIILLKRNYFNLFMLIAFLGFEGYSCVNTGDFSPIPFAALIVMMFVVCEKYNFNKSVCDDANLKQKTNNIIES